MPVLEVGGTHVAAALVDVEAGGVVDGSLRRAELGGAGSGADAVAALVRCGSELAVEPGAAWGVAVPGPFDYRRGIALFSGVGKFDDLYGADLRAALTEGLAARPGSVSFLNDADAFLLGEWLCGAASGVRRCVGITLGTGVGSAFAVDGEIREDGPGVPPEGRVDLLTVSGRPLEDVVSRRAIRAAYGPGAPDVAEIAGRARAGEPAAARVLTVAFGALGEVLAPWLAAFRAEVLVVGGSMAGSWDLVGPALRAGINRAAPEVRRAAAPARSALVGAAWRAAAETGSDRSPIV